MRDELYLPTAGHRAGNQQQNNSYGSYSSGGGGGDPEAEISLLGTSSGSTNLSSLDGGRPSARNSSTKCRSFLIMVIIMITNLHIFSPTATNSSSISSNPNFILPDPPASSSTTNAPNSSNPLSSQQQRNYVSSN